MENIPVYERSAEVKERLIVVGLYFGYPHCCILEFTSNDIGIDCLTEHQKKVHNNRGFIPCKSCAEKVATGEIAIDDLIKDRLCKSKYPNGGKGFDIDKVYSIVLNKFIQAS